MLPRARRLSLRTAAHTAHPDRRGRTRARGRARGGAPAGKVVAAGPSALLFGQPIQPRERPRCELSNPGVPLAQRRRAVRKDLVDLAAPPPALGRGVTDPRPHETLGLEAI